SSCLIQTMGPVLPASSLVLGVASTRSQSLSLNSVMSRTPSYRSRQCGFVARTTRGHGSDSPDGCLRTRTPRPVSITGLGLHLVWPEDDVHILENTGQAPVEPQMDT